MKKIQPFLIVLLPAFLLIFAAGTNAQNRKAVSGAEATGTFRDESGSEFSILALGRGKLRVAFLGIYVYKMAAGGDMANTGEAGGTAQIVGDTAVFKPEETEKCTITLKFLRPGRLRVTQKGTDSECGFGMNVYAGGTYKKVSGKKPKFQN